MLGGPHIMFSIVKLVVKQVSSNLVRVAKFLRFF